LSARRTPPPRPRNAAATREAILASARALFARHGYDGAGVRDIAAGAGVTAMLVNRYFGSKEKLYAAVIVETMKSPAILTSENLATPDVARTFAKALVGITRAADTPLDGFLILLRSAGSETAAAIGREQIESHNLRTMIGALQGEDAPERAALIFSLVAGVQVMRQMIGLSALDDADPERLVALLTPLFQQLMAPPA
jgi:AcrR family transcriptional regulator